MEKALSLAALALAVFAGCATKAADEQPNTGAADLVLHDPLRSFAGAWVVTSSTHGAIHVGEPITIVDHPGTEDPITGMSDVRIFGFMDTIYESVELPGRALVDACGTGEGWIACSSATPTCQKTCTQEGFENDNHRYRDDVFVETCNVGSTTEGCVVHLRRATLTRTEDRTLSFSYWDTALDFRVEIHLKRADL